MPDNNKQKPHTKSSSKEIEEPYIKVVCVQFEDYLKQRGYQPATAHDYARTLHHRDIEGYMQKAFGCRSIYWLTDDSMLVLVLESFRNRSSLEGRVKNATMRYREFLDDGNKRDEIQTLALSIERELKFKNYLMARGLSVEQAKHDSELLKDSRVSRVLCGNTCCKSLYDQTDIHQLEISRIHIAGTKVEKDEHVRDAIARYIDWVKDVNGDFAKACERKDAEEDRQVEIHQFEEMCDIAMHQNILDAYNYHVVECMKETGHRYLGLNHGREREYWEEYMKKAVAILYADQYKELSDHFMEFFNVEDRFSPARIVKALQEYAPGEKGWKYWQTLARWKMAERVQKTGYYWEGFSEGWYANEAPFDQKEACEMSNIEHDFSIYTSEERKKCADKVKELLIEAERNQKIQIGLDDYITVGDIQDIQELNKWYKQQPEQTGALQEAAMNNLFANSDYNAMKDEIDSLKNLLDAATKERDEANRKLEESEAKVAEFEKADSEKKIVEHDQMIADVFCEIMQRYMESTRCKSQKRREEVQKSLKDILFELKLDGMISRKMKKCINDFDNPEAPVVPQVIVQGDYVLQKHVDSQVNHVGEGGTGITAK